MAHEGHLKILEAGADAWHAWKVSNPYFRPDLSEAELSGAYLRRAALEGVNFHRAILSDADLRRARLCGASLANANLSNANLHSADLSHADLSGANLSGANLRNADLRNANLSKAILRNTDFRETMLRATVFADVVLSEAKWLDRCAHGGPSIVDHRTLERSKDVPLIFWRGCGLPDTLIDYMPSLTGDAIQFYSCFISYSSKDQEFADRLHADLQNHGVRCWFAPHDLPIGEKIWDGIDEAIRTRDKVLLILSAGAIESDWVEDEVTTAFAEERRRKQLVLFPVRLDDLVIDSDEPWAGKLRDNRNIGDFTQWKDHDAYWATFERVLRDLTMPG